MRPEDRLRESEPMETYTGIGKANVKEHPTVLLIG
jgi:hypothetical protein